MDQYYNFSNVVIHPWLRNCYLCNSKPRMIQINNLYVVRCPQCGLNIRHDNKDELVELWNKGKTKCIRPEEAFVEVKKFCDKHEDCEGCQARYIGCRDGLSPWNWSSLEWIYE